MPVMRMWEKEEREREKWKWEKEVWNEKSTRVGEGKYEAKLGGMAKKKMSSNFYECYLIEKRRLSLNRERRQDVYKKERKEQTLKKAQQFCAFSIYESQWLCFIFLRRMTLIVSFTCNSNDTATIYLLHWDGEQMAKVWRTWGTVYVPFCRSLN